MRSRWYSRGYLPHIDADGCAQFLTWRLADAVPVEAIERWADELRSLDDVVRQRELARRIERFADGGCGECLLRDSSAAKMVQEALFFGDGHRYDLHAWVVMPNHVHVLLTPSPGATIGQIVQSVKTFTSKEIGRLFGRTGTVWQADYFDRFVRREEQYARTKAYIEWNPVKAKLCGDPKHWPWSSANPDARRRLEVCREAKQGE